MTGAPFTFDGDTEVTPIEHNDLELVEETPIEKRIQQGFENRNALGYDPYDSTIRI